MITDISYFKSERFIPNLVQTESTGLSSSTLNNNDELQRLIDEYEIQFLSDAFGFYEAKTILGQLNEDGTVKTEADQKYKDLIDGNESIKWRGLRYEAANIKQSMVADYIYCKYVNQTDSRLSQIGNTVDQAEKSTVVSSWSKFVQAWRRMFEQRQWKQDRYYWSLEYFNSDELTLFDFISQTEGFSTQYFKFYENQNSIGL